MMTNAGLKRSQGISDSLIVIVFISLGLLGYSFRAIDWFSAIPGDLGDPRFNSVILEHLYGWVTGRWKDLWSPTFFYPFEGVLAFSDNHFGSAWSYILLRSIGLDREVAFAGWFVAGSFLNFIAAYFSFRRLGFTAVAAAAGAFVFAFSLPALAKELFAQLLHRFAVPLAFLAFWEFFEKRKLVSLGWLAFWIAVQFFCSIYLGVFLVYLLLATQMASWLGAMNGTLSVQKDMRSSESLAAKIYAIIAVAGSALAVLLLLAKYQSVASEYGFSRSKDEITSMLPRLSSYLLADRSGLSSWVGNWVVEVPIRWEHQMFFGIGVLCIALRGLWATWHHKLHHDLGRVATFIFLFLFLITLSIGGFSFYRLLLYLPGVGSIRAVSRIVLVMLLPVAILVAIGFESLVANISPATPVKRMLLVFALIVVLGSEVISYQPINTPISVWVNRQKDLRGYLPNPIPQNGVLFVTQRSTEPFYLAEIDSMILGQDLELPTLNGYSGNVPPGYMRPDPCFPFANRLLAYAAFRHMPSTVIDGIANNVMQISPEVCPHRSAVVSHENLPP